MAHTPNASIAVAVHRTVEEPEERSTRMLTPTSTAIVERSSTSGVKTVASGMSPMRPSVKALQ